jgi:sigma-B regulation protein RsbU (phosphoserine phosphatase)
MALQTNPYLIWQLIPATALLGIGLYIESRPVKKRESNVFSLMMFGGALWAFASAIQLITPDAPWQRFWSSITYLGIMVLPTSWFLLSVKLTGFGRNQIERFEKYLWIPPAVLYLLLLTNALHKLFFSSFEMVSVGGYVELENSYNILFYIHTAYSYVLTMLGIALLAISVVTKFKQYGVQAYGLILGVLAPLLGNAYFLFSSPRPGLPDPTPILFTVTGIAFAWAIFGGHILEVVPLAHEAIVRKLSTGILILDANKNIREINDAAREMLGFTSKTYVGDSLMALVEKNMEIALIVNHALDSSLQSEQVLQLDFPPTNRSFDVHVSRVGDGMKTTSGWLIQFNDISEKKKAEENLVATQKTLKDVLDTLQDPYFEVLRSGQLVYVNQALSQRTGRTRDELLGRHFRIVASRKSMRETAEKHEEMFETGKPIPPFDFIYRRKDGQEFASEIVVSPILDDGKVVGARGIIRDISVRVQAEAILRQAKDAAESRAGELAVINRVALTVGQSLHLKDILQSVCRELTSIFEIRNAGIGLLTPDKANLEIVAFHSPDPNEKSVLGMFLPIEGNTSSKEVIEQKKMVFIQDAQNDPRTSSVADISKSRGTRSIMIVPLLARGEAIGTIGMPAKDPNHVFTQNEIQLAETIASQIAAAVDNAQLHARTESALGVAERDLEIGRQIQSGFFPEKLPDIPGWEVAAHFHPARQVAGDFYDAFRIKDSDLITFIIADVCDKGVGAALFMVLFRSLLRAFSEMRITKQDVHERLLNIILNTNNFIAEYHGKSNMFATLFFGVLDPTTGTLYYVNGGHEPPIILDADGSVIRRLMPTGPAVGMFPDMEFRVEYVNFNEGEMLIGFTDGITDARDPLGEKFSEERLLKSISKPWSSNFSMLYQLNTELQKHIGMQDQFDDITLISFRRNSSCDTGLRHTMERKAELSALREMRDFVEAAATYSNLARNQVFAFKLAADELCSNIIQYGFEGRQPGTISLWFMKTGDVAMLCIQDDGKFFSPDQVQSPHIEAGWEEREIGGLGIYFVKELMDNVSYNRTEHGVNQFILEKKIGTTRLKGGVGNGNQRSTN